MSPEITPTPRPEELPAIFRERLKTFKESGEAFALHLTEDEYKRVIEILGINEVDPLMIESLRYSPIWRSSQHDKIVIPDPSSANGKKLPLEVVFEWLADQNMGFDDPNDFEIEARIRQADDRLIAIVYRSEESELSCAWCENEDNCDHEPEFEYLRDFWVAGARPDERDRLNTTHQQLD